MRPRGDCVYCGHGMALHDARGKCTLLVCRCKRGEETGLPRRADIIINVMPSPHQVTIILPGAAVKHREE